MSIWCTMAKKWWRSCMEINTLLLSSWQMQERSSSRKILRLIHSWNSRKEENSSCGRFKCLRCKGVKLSKLFWHRLILSNTMNQRFLTFSGLTLKSQSHQYLTCLESIWRIYILSRHRWELLLAGIYHNLKSHSIAMGCLCKWVKNKSLDLKKWSFTKRSGNLRRQQI